MNTVTDRKAGGKSPGGETEKQAMKFQADTRQLLDLMINSIYTHKQIFLRELLSNASDALDKIRFLSLTDSEALGDQAELGIELDIDKEGKTITISDNGIGMSYDEVVENIGTIAKSGTRNFLDHLEKTQDADLIGQFGVGFYSAFMVAKKVRLISRGYREKQGVCWESTGDGSFTVEKVDKHDRGTSITLFLRKEFTDKATPQTDYLNQYTIRNLVQEYSNYIQYPIKMDMVRKDPPRDKDGNEITGEEWTTTIENQTLNSMIPIWKKDKKEISDEEYFTFYKHHYKDWNEYADVMHIHIEGKLEYHALLYIPCRAPSDLYSKDFAKGIQLYSNSIFVMNDCKELLPEHLRFVRGLVDSPDFSLNISREILQHDLQLKKIGKNLEKKVLSALKKLLKDKREKYEEIWEEFGKAIKGGIYMDISNREKLRDLLLFRSSHKDGSYTTLKEYVERMGESQKEIYYAAGKDIETIRRMPQLEIFNDRNIEILYFVDKIDEFMINNLGDYDDRKLVSVVRKDFDLDEVFKDEPDAEETEISDSGDDREEPVQTQDQPGKYQDLLQGMKEILGEKIEEVKISKRLKSSPVCLVTGNTGTTFNMEQLLRGANQIAPKAKKILEINPEHKLFTALNKSYDKGRDSSPFKNCTELMYYQAMLVEGYELENPVEISNQIAELLINAYSE